MSLSVNRVCSSCGRLLPLAEFERNDRVCDTCCGVVDMEEINAKSRKKAMVLFRKMISGARPDTINAPHVSELCAEIVDQLGGVEGVGRRIADGYNAATKKDPAGKVATQYASLIARMVKDSTTMRDSAPDAVSMTDEELASEMMGLFESVAHKHGIEQGASEAVIGLVEDKVEKDDGEPEQDQIAGDGVCEAAEGSPEDIPSNS